MKAGETMTVQVREQEKSWVQLNKKLVIRRIEFHSRPLKRRKLRRTKLLRWVRSRARDITDTLYGKAQAVKDTAAADSVAKARDTTYDTVGRAKDTTYDKVGRAKDTTYDTEQRTLPTTLP